MSTLRINNIEAKSVPASPTLDEKIKLTNSSGDVLVHIDGKNSGITTIGINTTASNITFDANSNIVVTGIITATKFVGTIEGSVSGDLSISDKIIHTGDTNTAIRFPAADTITAETGGSEKVRITSAGDVGIGTALPPTWATGSNLSIAGTDGGQLELKKISSDIRHYVWADDDLNIAAGYAGAGSGGSSALNLKVNGNNTRVRIDSNGRLMVNQTTHQGSTSKLEVTGTLDNSYPGYSFPLMINDDAAYNSSAGPGGGIGFSFKQNSGGAYAQAGGIRGIKENTTDGNYASALTFYTRPNGGGTAERMRISSAGHVTKPAHPSFSAKGVGATFTYFDDSSAWYSLGDTVLTNTSYKNDQNFTTSHSFGMNRGVLSNGNSCFNADTTVFTAPVDGFYHFCISLYMRASQGGGTAHISPWINNSNTNIYNYNGSDISGGGDLAYPPATRTIDVKLSAGDTFFWAVYSVGTDKFSIYQDYSYMSGYLIG